MSDVRRLIVHLDETFAVCRAQLGASVRQLHEWTGEFRSSSSGASPATAVGGFGPPPRQVDGEDEDRGEEARLSKVESDALSPDDARRSLVRCYEIVDRLVVEVGDLGDSLGGETLPHPVDRLAARLAFVQWQINKLVRARVVPRSGVSRLEVAVGLVNELAAICESSQPAPAVKRPVDVCHAHEQAGLDASIDSKYRRWHLCRWCGDFRMTHEVNPPPKLVRLHDRGISMSTSLLRSAGIRVGDSRRGA